MLSIMKPLYLSMERRQDSTGVDTSASRWMSRDFSKPVRKMNCESTRRENNSTSNLHSVRLVFVHDPTDDADYVIPIGKQTLHPSHIFYTPCSGIWQSVWIEPVPANHVSRLDIDGNMEGQGEQFSLI